MKTTPHIYNPSFTDFQEDTPAARTKIFRWHQEWTGQSEFDQDAEPFANLRVEDVRDFTAEEDMESIDKEFPFQVLWEAPAKPMHDWETCIVARFTDEEQADRFAAAENTHALATWIADDNNFPSINLPEGVSVECSTVKHGKYPQSRNIDYCIQFPHDVTEDEDGDPTDTIKGTFYFSAQGFDDQNIPLSALASEIQSVLDDHTK